MSDPEGFIITHRKMLKWEWFTDVNTAHLFLYCLLRANFKDTTWRGIEIKRGSFITSLEKLAAETGLSVKQVRVALQKLIDTGEVANKPTSKYRIITVKNYDYYQREGKQKGKQKGKLRANKGQAEGKQRATDNNDNNGTMKTSEGVRPTGALPSHTTTALLDIAPEGESAAPQEERQLPLFTHEWKAYCERYHSDKTEDEIWERWEELDNGRRLSRKAIEEIREKISDG